MVEALITLLMELKRIPGDHVTYWQERGKTFSVQMVNENQFVAALYPGEVYLLRGLSRNARGGIMITEVLDMVSPQSESVVAFDCSSDAGKTQNLALVGQFDRKQKGQYLTNPTQAWLVREGTFTDVPTANVVCYNSRALASSHGEEH